MHTKLLEEATHEQLKSFLFDQFNELKDTMPKLYREMECELYEHIHGEHFSPWKYDWAVSELENEDGTRGAHWNVDDITAYAKSHGATYKNYNEYDMAYAMNMVYSDYYGSVPDNLESYFRVAKAFLEDKDAPEGKAWKYWKAMR